MTFGQVGLIGFTDEDIPRMSESSFCAANSGVEESEWGFDMAGMPQERMINAIAIEPAARLDTSSILTRQLQNWLSIYTIV